MILAGDVGGTKTLLGLFQQTTGGLQSIREASFPSREFGSLGEIVQKFLSAGRQNIDRFVVGVAGPVVNGRSQVVNLRWPVDARRLARHVSLPAVRVLNDLEATAWGIPDLPRSKSENLTPGLRTARANAAVIAAGTGLGMALLLWDGERYHPCASEGGHQEFGPRDDFEIELLEFLRRRHGRVSIERLVAGPGVTAIYQFLVESGQGKESGTMRQRIAAAKDVNRAISEAGLADDDPLARRALDKFVELYGAAAGNLALAVKATGGIWVAGGIAPKILPRIRSGGFIRAFRAKGRLSPLLEKIPVRIVLEPRTALLGAAACAARMPRTSKQSKSSNRKTHKVKR